MNNRRLLSFGIIAGVVCMSASVFAGAITFTCKTDKPEAVYTPGEKMIFNIQVLEDGKPVAGKKLKWTREGDDGKKETGESVSSDTQPMTVATSLNTPGFVHVFVDVMGDDGKVLMNAQNKPVRFEGGAGVELAKLASIPEPADFDAYWQKQKERLKEVPIKADLKEVDAKKEGFLAYDVKIDCPGGKPVSGYLVVPKEAKANSLPAQVGFQGYGVRSASIVPKPGMIYLEINAHGIENGKELEFYKNLQTTQLKGYAFNNKENENPDTAYFNGMVMRVLRSLEYVKTRPEWNKKDLFVGGGSQGGLQSIWAAALDPAVTRCNVAKPWCSDLGGVTVGRVKGWRPDWVAGLGYYDCVNFAKRIKCPVTITSGLGDYTCPPSGITVLYNNITAPKKITYIQGSTHMFDPPGADRFTIESK